MHRAREEALVVRIAPWANDAVSPACLMIDDLTDGWIDRDGSGLPRGRNDWGAGMDEPGSSFRFLADGLLREFPEVRTTFFVPVARVPDIRPERFACTFRPIDARPEFVRFLRALAADPRFEFAYHGKEHSVPGPTEADFVAEFDQHVSVSEALATVRAGEQVWKGVFGTSPTGGKYPAYARGAHGDTAVDLARFAWWCRRWDRGLGLVDDPAAFQPRFFGESSVVDVPSTVDGGVMTLPTPLPLQSRAAVYYGRVLLRSGAWLRAQLDALLAQRAVITVQEHITSSRPDARAQTPNVYDDGRTLDRIFRYLRRHPVWHATCGEIASYFRSRERTRVAALSDERFLVSRDEGAGPMAPLSLVLNGLHLPEEFVLKGPRGEIRARVARRSGAMTSATAPIDLEPGVYEIVGGARV
jgi:hypothetical protein